MKEITIWQKIGITHTKFIIMPDGKPFPMDNFNLAVSWMEQGLLKDRTEIFIKDIMGNMK
jgi:hypothetical protein